METSSSGGMGLSGKPSPAGSLKSQPDNVKLPHGAPLEEESTDQEEVIVFETSLLPLVEVETAQLSPSLDPSCNALDDTLLEEGSDPEVLEGSGGIVGSSQASYFKSNGPQVKRCFQVASWPPQGDTDTSALLAICIIQSVTLAYTFAGPLQQHNKNWRQQNQVCSEFCWSYLNASPGRCRGVTNRCAEIFTLVMGGCETWSFFSVTKL